MTMTMTRTKNLGFSGRKQALGHPRVLDQKNIQKIEKNIGMEDLEEMDISEIKESELASNKHPKGPIRIMKSLDSGEEWANSRDLGKGLVSNSFTQRGTKKDIELGKNLAADEEDFKEQSDEMKIENFHSFKSNKCKIQIPKVNLKIL